MTPLDLTIRRLFVQTVTWWWRPDCGGQWGWKAGDPWKNNALRNQVSLLFFWRLEEPHKVEEKEPRNTEVIVFLLLRLPAVLLVLLLTAEVQLYIHMYVHIHTYIDTHICTQIHICLYICGHEEKGNLWSIILATFSVTWRSQGLGTYSPLAWNTPPPALLTDSSFIFFPKIDLLQRPTLTTLSVNNSPITFSSHPV